jgi:hypothetical protein
LLHQLIAIGETIAVVSALGANLGALAADMAGMMGSAGHERDGHSADLFAVLQQSLVFGRSVLAAKMQAVMSGLGTDSGTLGAVLHAGEHFFGGHFV